MIIAYASGHIFKYDFFLIIVMSLVILTEHFKVKY